MENDLIEKAIDLVLEDDFSDADKKVHSVEDQWHYPIMTKYGYVALDKTGVGFVRSYKYEHPETKRRIIVSTGYSADYWNDKEDEAFGYWTDLEPHLQEVQT